jgi:hypothetical protein
MGWARGFAPASWYRAHAVDVPLPGPREGEAARRFDALAASLLDLHLEERRMQDAFGEWDFGDWPLGSGWGNLEYDTAFGFLLQFYRTGDPRWLEEATAGLDHWADVDRFAASGQPLWPGLPRVHGRRHGTIAELGHVWLDGVLHGFYLTGDPFLADAFRDTAAAVARAVEARSPESTSRERNAAWALHALAAAWEATREPRYLAAMRDLGSRILARIDPIRGFPRFDRIDPVPPSEEARFRVSPPVTAGILVPALGRLHRAAPDAALRESIVRIMDWILDEATDAEIPGIRGSLQIREGDGETVRRGGFRRGDWALFACRGFACALEAGGDPRFAAEGRRQLASSIRYLEERRPSLDGRGRSRILLNAPFALVPSDSPGSSPRGAGRE